MRLHHLTHQSADFSLNGHKLTRSKRRARKAAHTVSQTASSTNASAPTSQNVTTVQNTAPTPVAPAPDTQNVLQNTLDTLANQNLVLVQPVSQPPVAAPGGSTSQAPAFPGAASVGVPATMLNSLTPGGSMVITKAGTVIDAMDIKGSIIIKADNVTIRNSRVSSNDFWTIRIEEGYKGAVIENTEVIGGRDAAIGGANWTGRNLNIHGSVDGVKADGNVLIENSWIHDLAEGPDTHNDGVQIMGGDNITIRGTRIEGASNAAVFMKGEGGAVIHNVTLEGNHFIGGGWTVYDQGIGNVIKNNVFEDSGYGPISYDGTNTVFSGNTYNGKPISS
ncbi:MAG: right-handed parallel beta-helix repeat-containing protein [Candidatus Melainabacteria bacterium]